MEPSPAHAPGRAAGASAPAAGGDGGQPGARPLARKLRPWLALLLIGQAVLIVVRWHMGDAHGALLMLTIWAVGVLAVSVGADTVYCGYFGFMVFVSGLLDLNLAIESVIWNEWKSWQRRALEKGDLSNFVKPAVYLVCSAVQLASAFIAYLLFKEAESLEESEHDEAEEALFTTEDQVRIYNAVVAHGGRGGRGSAGRRGSRGAGWGSDEGLRGHLPQAALRRARPVGCAPSRGSSGSLPPPPLLLRPSPGGTSG